MLTEFHRNPQLADAYTDGLTTGIRLAEAWQDDQPPSICLCGPCVRMWARRVLAAILGFALGAFFVFWLIPHAAQSHAEPFSGLTRTQVTTLAADIAQPPMHHVTVRLNAPWTCHDPYALYWVHVRGTHINFKAVCVNLAGGGSVLEPYSFI